MTSKIAHDVIIARIVRILNYVGNDSPAIITPRPNVRHSSDI